MARRKRLWTGYRDTLQECVDCAKTLKEDYGIHTQIEISEDTAFGGWWIECWSIGE